VSSLRLPLSDRESRFVDILAKCAKQGKCVTARLLPAGVLMSRPSCGTGFSRVSASSRRDRLRAFAARASTRLGKPRQCLCADDDDLTEMEV